MKNKIVKLIILLVTAVLLNIHSIQAENEIGLEIKTTETIIRKIKQEYVNDVKQIILVNGSIKGINGVLKEYNVPPLSPVDETLPDDKQLEKLITLISDTLNNYPKIKKDTIISSAIKGALGALEDPFTQYLSREEYKKILEQMEGGNFGGIGIYIEIDPKEKILTVVEPIEDTPAYKAGLKSGDKIIEINGKSTKGISVEEAQSLLRGPVESTVTITVESAEGKTTRTITLTRAFIHIKSLEAKITDNNIGYIKLKIFGEETSKELEEALIDFEKNGVKGYILDLRNNGGGYISTAVEISSKFLPSMSPILFIEGKNIPETSYKSLPNFRIPFPIVILVNQYSASAAEIVAGAFQDLKKGTIIGSQTFGKASVQSIYPLLDGSAVKITTAKYLTPNKRDLNKIGLKPDIVIKMDVKKIGQKDDIQLEKAVNLLNEEIKSKYIFKPYWEGENFFAKVYSISEEYSLLKKENKSLDFNIKRHILIYSKEKICDLIEIEDAKNKKIKTFIFDVSGFFKS